MAGLIKLLLAVLITFAVSLSLGPLTIQILHRLKFGQSIRNDGPQSHLKKAGTPTMGGILIMVSLIAGLAAADIFTPEVRWVLFLTISFGLIGLVDDLIIVVAKRSLGLKARQKLFAQIVLAGFVAAFMVQGGFPNAQLVPFTNLSLTFPNFGFGNPLFFVYTVFVIVAISNAVNLTDGLDGLASGTTAFAALAFGALAFLQGHPSLGALSVILASACFGFIWFNGPPAQVFMGDTGSLALGAALAGIALFSQLSLFFLIIGGIFVSETLSVVIQVISFKTSGKRVFRMSPLHHHFELGGMLEPKIMIRFWMVGVVLGIVGILGYLVK